MCRQPVTLAAPERAGAAALAGRLRREQPGLVAPPVHPLVTTGHADLPALAIEDHSAITLFEQRGNALYSYRALWLAGDGDLVAVAARRSRGFEEYARCLLRLRGTDVVDVGAPAPGESFAACCAREPALVAAAAERAHAAGGFQLLPYMGSDGVWALAASIAERAGIPVRVAAPPPALTRRVNDKAWFDVCVRELLGGGAHPPSLPVHGLAVLAARARSLARAGARVVVKLPSSASAAGNLLLDAATLAAPLREVAAALRARLTAAGWRGGWPLLLSAWEGPVAVSPSVQLWVPAREQGDPLVLGVFEQRVCGRAAAFAGAEPSALPPAWRERLAREAVRLALVFQALGYFGPCSFDAIVVGHDLGRARLHWIECNGRLGGVSIPLLVATRLLGAASAALPLVVEERGGLAGGQRDFGAVAAALGELLLQPGGDRGAVVLSPTPVEDGVGFELLVLDRDRDAARDLGARATRRLLAMMDTGA